MCLSDRRSRRRKQTTPMSVAPALQMRRLHSEINQHGQEISQMAHDAQR
jgi:hypothetical protein